MTRDPKLSRDSEGLGAWGTSQFTVGHVDEVNGAGAVEMRSFVATRHELVTLLKYWARTAVDIEFEWFLTTTVGSSDTRLHAFACRRVETISQSLGETEARTLVEQAHEEYSNGVDERAWHIFRHGTEEERDAFQEEFQRALSLPASTERDAAQKREDASEGTSITIEHNSRATTYLYYQNREWADPKGRHLAALNGYEPGDNLDLVYEGEVFTHDATPLEHICDYIWALHNRDDRPRANEIRSMCVGDVLVMGRRAFSVEPLGFKEVELPASTISYPQGIDHKR